jgi:hypothetical protein
MAMTALTLAGVLTSVGSMTAQQQQPCLHGQVETDAHRARRQQALRLTRQINSLQAVAQARTQAYQALAGLPNVAVPPEGFAVHLVTDGASYALSVKDTVDPCYFAYFSDQNGLIYTGQPLQ